MKSCVNCGSRVIAKADGTCPSCRGSTDVKSEAVADAPAEAPAKTSTRRLPMVGALLGVAVAAVLTNLSSSGGIDAMTVVTALGALAGGIVGVFGVRALLKALRR